ncbi:MAG: ferredoxin, partial [Myxococcaceae bacterium]
VYLSIGTPQSGPAGPHLRRVNQVWHGSQGLPGNATGNWFADDTCMGCDASRQSAPGLIEARDGMSLVVRQPATVEERQAMSRSIGSGRDQVRVDVFPQRLDEGVWLTGYDSPRAYGGTRSSFSAPRATWSSMVRASRST